MARVLSRQGSEFEGLREMVELFLCFRVFLCFSLAAIGVVGRDGPIMTEASVNIGTRYSTRAAV